MRADREQRFGWRHIDPSADPDVLWRDVEVEAGADALRRNKPRPEAGGDMVLVRLLVLREPRVAIETVDRLTRLGEVVGGEALHGRVHRLHQLEHGLLELLFEDRLARQEPI